jgi:hypothetical protein
MSENTQHDFMGLAGNRTEGLQNRSLKLSHSATMLNFAVTGHVTRQQSENFPHERSSHMEASEIGGRNTQKQKIKRQLILTLG